MDFLINVTTYQFATRAVFVSVFVGLAVIGCVFGEKKP